MPIDPPIITVVTAGSLIIIANLISYIKQSIKNKQKINGEMIFNNSDDTGFVKAETGVFDFIIQRYNHSIPFKTFTQLIFLLVIVLLLHDCRVL